MIRYRKAVYRKAGGTTTLYHIGPHPPRPVLKMWTRDWGEEDLGFERWWLKERSGEVVFMTPDPILVGVFHGLRGNVYAYEVPQWVIAESGGVHRYDYAPEVIIPKKLWPEARFVGKVYNAKEFDRVIDRVWMNMRASKRRHKPELPPPLTEQDRSKADRVLQVEKQRHRQKKKYQQWLDKINRRR